MNAADTKDILRQLTAAEVLELKELYLIKYGADNFHYLLLYNQCKWNEQLAQLDTTNAADEWIAFRKNFYTHSAGDFRTYGTYISLHYDMLQSVSFHSWQTDGDELLECLRKTQLIAWETGPLLTNVDKQFCEAVKQIAADKGVEVQNARVCTFVILPTERALNLKIPSLASEFVLAPLQEQHVDSIYDLWKNKSEGSLQYLKGLLTLNKHLGVYRADNAELVAWTYQQDFAGIGMLETIADEQRRGLATILVASLSKQIAEQEGIQVSAWIRKTNLKSLTLFSKIGFETIVDVEWIQLQNKENLSCDFVKN